MVSLAFPIPFFLPILMPSLKPPFSWGLMMNVALPHATLCFRSLFEPMVHRSCFYTCHCPLQLREGKGAEGKMHLTALLATTISSYLSIMPEAVKSERQFVFENKFMIPMCLECNIVVGIAFFMFHLQQNRNIWNIVQGLPITQDSGFNIPLMC